MAKGKNVKVKVPRKWVDLIDDPGEVKRECRGAVYKLVGRTADPYVVVVGRNDVKGADLRQGKQLADKWGVDWRTLQPADGSKQQLGEFRVAVQQMRRTDGVSAWRHDKAWIDEKTARQVLAKAEKQLATDAAGEESSDRKRERLAEVRQRTGL